VVNYRSVGRQDAFAADIVLVHLRSVGCGLFVWFRGRRMLQTDGNGGVERF
jgi:hypothetical protein